MVMLVMCMGAVLALSLVLVSALLSKLPRHPLRAPDSHGPVHSYGHLQDWSVEASVVMLVVFMGAMRALSLALVCVAPLCTLLPMLVTPTRRCMLCCIVFHCLLAPCDARVLHLQIQATTPTQGSAKGRKRRRRARKPTKPHNATAASATADSRMYGRHTAQLAVFRATLHSNREARAKNEAE